MTITTVGYDLHPKTFLGKYYFNPTISVETNNRIYSNIFLQILIVVFDSW